MVPRNAAMLGCLYCFHGDEGFVCISTELINQCLAVAKPVDIYAIFAFAGFS